MYYEGTIQIVDRGDAPALEVIDRNARSLAQRAADETQEELKRVLSRVDNIYGSYESFNAMETTLNSSLEYVDGIQELEEILRDHIKKKKYKQQVTIFIVGYQDVCHEKLTLLQQVNEFFMTNAKNFEKENWDDPTPEIDLDDVASKIEDSLNTAEELTGRLSEINKEMVSYLTSHASHKGSHKAKKKMEKSLQQAKDDINSLSERLLAAQAELDAKEEKISTLLKQAEAKHMEVQRYKTAAEVAKKNMKDTERLQQEFDKRGVLLQEYQNKVESLGLELTQTSLSKAKSEERFSHSGQDNLKKISELQQLVQEKQVALDEAKRDLERLHEMQILSLQEAHQAEMDELQKTHAAEIQQLMKELKNCKEKLVQDTSTHVHEEVAEYKEKLENIESPARGSESSLSGPAVDTVKETADPSATGLDDQSVAPEPDDQANAIPEVPDDQSVSSKISATSSKDEAKTTGREPQRSRSQTSTSSKKSGGRESKQSSKTSLKQKSEGGTDPVPSGIKEYADVAVQDEGGNPDAATVSSHHLDMVREETGDFSNSYDLQDEESWASVPKDQTTGRFMQYRKLTRKRLADLEDQLATTVRKTHKKVDTLKAQFQEHKSKWEAERNVLVQQIGQAMRLQSEAENEADVAMSQLEDFIIEQEKLENLEDQKHEELSRQTTKLAEEAQAKLAAQTEERAQNITPADQTPGGRTSTAKGNNADTTLEVTAHPEVMETKSPSRGSDRKGEQSDGETVEPGDNAERPASMSKEGEPELTKLLQQTDDAKVQELKRSSTTLSAAPTLETPVKDTGPRSQSAQPTSNENLNLSTASNDEIREMMSKSRASLRSEYKARLTETKLAVEDRRSKSPAVSIPSLHSLDEDQLIEDDEDLDALLPDNRKDSTGSYTAEKGTSPPSARRNKQSASPSVRTPHTPRTPYTPRTLQTPQIPHSPTRGSAQGSARGSARGSSWSQQRKPSVEKDVNPIVQEYLESYGGVVSFKEDLSKLLMDKDMMTASQMLTELESVAFQPEEEVEPQLRKMTKNLHYILDELMTLFGTILVSDREPVVSSLVNYSREPTRTNVVTREQTDDSGHGFTPVNGRNRSAGSRQSDKCMGCQNETVTELREACTLLQCQLDVEARKHQEQIRKNTQMMMEMQKTIEELQKELAALTKTAEGMKEPPPIPTIMFTRMDSERNAKIMKKALNEDRLNTDQYKEAVRQMDQYVSLPAQRLAQLVRKYVHHRCMKKIEDNVRHSKNLNENVFEILDKMEDLQNKRAKEWTDNMDALGVERCRLASLLMETLDNIEQESGIFLIKPIYSLKGRDFKERFGGKLSRLNRPNHEPSPTRNGCRSAMTPAPTPVSNTRPGTRASDGGRLGHTQSETALFARHALFEPNTGVSGLGMVWRGGQPRPVWNLTDSQAKELSNENLTSYANQNYNTPRILELDVNRMLIGQNNVSTRVRAGLTDDRLVNAVNNSVRSYVTVNRPTVAPGQSRFSAEGAVPPSTPYRPLSGHSRSDQRRIPTSPPLPPIHLSRGHTGSKVVEIHSPSAELSYPPRSPPGSSLRLTPPLKERGVPSPLDAFA